MSDRGAEPGPVGPDRRIDPVTGLPVAGPARIPGGDFTGFPPGSGERLTTALPRPSAWNPPASGTVGTAGTAGPRPEEHRPYRQPYPDRPGRPADYGPQPEHRYGPAAERRWYPAGPDRHQYQDRERPPGDDRYDDAYPTEPDVLGRSTHRPPMPRGAHLPPYREPLIGPPTGAAVPNPNLATGGRSPRKLTVTRVAALRSRELTHRGVQMFHRATRADGADRSGLTHLTYAVMANYAVDAALTVALANTIFFADTGSTGKVLSYLVITVAPFALIAPFIGPMLDRIQNGRRIALSVSSFGRALLAIVMAFNFSPFNPWIIYPCALGNLVLSKAFSVLKAALTPRVLPEQITLVKTNSRLTVFGLIAGGLAGGVAALFLKVTGSPGALIFTAVCAIAGGVLCLRIPAWVESTKGEVPVKTVVGGRRGFPTIVVATLWANSVIRVETGFLALFIAFVVKNQYPSDHQQHSAFTQLFLLSIVGAAAVVGGFLGNALGARLNLSAPEVLSIIALAAVVLSTLVAVLAPGLATAAIVGFVGSTASSLAKVCLDSVIQHHLPEASRASAFGKSESVLQLAWVFGGVLGLLIGGVWFGHFAAVYSIGFGVISVLLVLGLVQCWLLRSGRTLIPKIPLPRRRRTGTGLPRGEMPGTVSRSTSGLGGQWDPGQQWDGDRQRDPGQQWDPGRQRDPGSAAVPLAKPARKPGRQRRTRKAGSGR